MERRKLDRNACPFIDAATTRGPADGVDGAFVFVEIARRILGGGRRLSQHVIGKGEAARLAITAVCERLLDGASGDELLAHKPHGDVDAGADDRLAAARDETGQRRRQALLAGRGYEPARQHQAPGGGVDEQRRALTDMRAPVAGRELVADQRVAGRGVGNAQQCFGEAHQRHALLARQRIFVDQTLDAARARLRPQLGDEAMGERADAVRFVRVRACELDERRYALRLGRPVGGGDRAPERRLRHDLAAERGEDVGGVGHVTLPEADPTSRAGAKATGAILFLRKAFCLCP